MWYEAAKRARSFDANQIRQHLYGAEFDSPQGRLVMQPSHHTSKPIRIGRVRADGQFDVIHTTAAQAPRPWNKWLPDTQTFGCDWSDAAKGGKYPLSTVNVGVLHSVSGPLSFSERPVLLSTLMTIDQINDAGGVKLSETDSRTIIPVIRDGASTPSAFAALATEMINTHQVAAVFGGWTSASRVAMKPVFESLDNLLFYPVQFESQECSRNIIYCGQSANQQIEPALMWALHHFPPSKPYLLLGSDYVFPRTANAIARSYLETFGAKVVDEIYLSLGQEDTLNLTDVIKSKCPAPPLGLGCVILNTLNGIVNNDLFLKLNSSQMDSVTWPTLSFSIGEAEAEVIGFDYVKGHFSSWYSSPTLILSTLFLFSFPSSPLRPSPH
jgi:urea transport system substrate-binding protein